MNGKKIEKETTTTTTKNEAHQQSYHQNEIHLFTPFYFLQNLKIYSMYL